MYNVYTCEGFCGSTAPTKHVSVWYNQRAYRHQATTFYLLKFSSKCYFSVILGGRNDPYWTYMYLFKAERARGGGVQLLGSPFQFPTCRLPGVLTAIPGHYWLTLPLVWHAVSLIKGSPTEWGVGVGGWGGWTRGHTDCPSLSLGP